MNKLREEQPSSFTELITLIEDLQSECEGPLWYRGCGKVSYKLTPSLYRHPQKTTIADIAKLEQALITRFRQRSIPFQERRLHDDEHWDTLFYMQHYGVPTRLLDWTENPFVALHFAVMSCPLKLDKRGRNVFECQAAMWILNPVLWNRRSLSHQSFDGDILIPGDDALKGYQPTSPFSEMCNHPVALYGAHNSPRIVAQRGVFMIFGQNTRSMEDTHREEGFPENCLIKVKFTKKTLNSLKYAVLNHGITESVVFPDLDGLAREIRRTFEFEG